MKNVLIVLSIMLASGIICQNISAAESKELRVDPIKFDCNSIKDISIPECQSLIAIYKAFNGSNWQHSYSWFRDLKARNWPGVAVRQGHVRSLSLQSLYDRDLTGSIPKEIGDLVHLEGLFISGKNITGTIPEEIGNLAQLKLLGLGGNSLTGSIPKEIGRLQNLEYLSLSGNKLSGQIPVELGNLLLIEDIYLDNNLFEGSIPELLNPDLAVFSYSNNPLLIGNMPEYMCEKIKSGKLDDYWTGTTGGSLGTGIDDSKCH